MKLKPVANFKENRREKTRRRVIAELYKIESPSFLMLKSLDSYFYKLERKPFNHPDFKNEIEAYAKIIFQRVHQIGNFNADDERILYGLYNYIDFSSFDTFNDDAKRKQLLNRIYSEATIETKLSSLTEFDFNTEAIAKEYHYNFISIYHYARNLVSVSLKKSIKNINVIYEEVEEEALKQTVTNNLRDISNNWIENKNVIINSEEYSNVKIGRAFKNLFYFGNKENLLPTRMAADLLLESGEGNGMSAKRVRYAFRKADQGEAHFREKINAVKRYTYLTEDQLRDAYNQLLKKEAETMMHSI